VEERITRVRDKKGKRKNEMSPAGVKGEQVREEEGLLINSGV